MFETAAKIKRLRLVFNICVVVAFAALAVFAYGNPELAPMLFRFGMGGVLLISFLVNNLLGRKQKELGTKDETV